MEYSLNRELGRTYWEVVVQNDMTKNSVTIDAETGEILEIEMDD
ncbi:PepSY domain-containing protein [Enterococcus thailandicus]|nr:PepSY domain-containing protein [Enterococcus thailandicus]